MGDRTIEEDAPHSEQAVPRPLLLTSRCRLTPKGRLYTDPALRANAPPGDERTGGSRFNATARYVIERCDGSASVADLARALAGTWRVSEAQALQDVVTFLEALRQQGLVRIEEYGAADAESS